ncbi:hypothetical protein N7G274_008051 [Stereocaulon virgatum]|uniref:Uncharacterized protein n=1 Tax=Stereocaulon virgatum TaxID=373712 RepID=A0ABR4A7S6_9LECA
MVTFQAQLGPKTHNSSRRSHRSIRAMAESPAVSKPAKICCDLMALRHLDSGHHAFSAAGEVETDQSQEAPSPNEPWIIAAMARGAEDSRHGIKYSGEMGSFHSYA